MKKNNKKFNLEAEDVVITEEENSLLVNATINFFPKEGRWNSNCYERPQDLKLENLPCHLRDDMWLSKMLEKKEELSNINFNKILHFVKISSFFQEKRHEYELEIVKWQINWINKGGENWVIDESLGGEMCMFLPTCDIAFRKSVVDTLSSIGMDLDAIEEGIEKNASLWRDSQMMCAFNNQYDSFDLYTDFTSYWFDDNENKKTIEPIDPEFKEKWLKYRKYEYYQKHKDSVDKYGIVDEDMKLSDEKAKELKIYLDQKHDERMTQIEKFNQERDNHASHQTKQKDNKPNSSNTPFKSLIQKLKQ